MSFYSLESLLDAEAVALRVEWDLLKDSFAAKSAELRGLRVTVGAKLGLSSCLRNT